MKFTFYLLQLLLSLTLCQSVFAQQKFEPGFVVSIQQDTLKGYIEYLNWSKNPKKINFKTSLDGTEKVYGLSEIFSFYVHGENYVKACVEVDDTPYKTGELTNSPISKNHPDTVLLKVMVSGNKSLFFLKDEDAKEHFYIKKDTIYQWLTSYKYEFGQSEKSGIVVVDTYKQELDEYLSSCDAIAGKISSLTYSQKSLSELFRIYYQKCSDNNPNIVYKTEEIKTELGIIGGFTATKVKWTGPSAAFLLKGSFPVSRQIAGGIFLNLVLPRTQKKVSIYNELFFSSYKVTNHTEKYVSEQDHSFTDLSIGFSYLKLNNMAHYTIPLNDASVFFNVGISNGLAISEHNYNRTVTYLYSNQGSINEKKLVKDVRKYEQGLLFGAGVRVKKVSVELRCELGNGMSSYNDLKSSVRRYLVLLSYRLR